MQNSYFIYLCSNSLQDLMVFREMSSSDDRKWNKRDLNRDVLSCYTFTIYNEEMFRHMKKLPIDLQK